MSSKLAAPSRCMASAISHPLSSAFACKTSASRSPSDASSTPLLCSSVSLYGVRHMAKPSSAVFCWLRLQDIGRLGSPSDPHMPARLRCFAAPSRCMASAIWQNRHPLSSAGFACKTSAASALRPILTCQLDSAALQLRLAVWRPPYGKTVIRCLLQASPARHRPPVLPHVWIWYYNL